MDKQRLIRIARMAMGQRKVTPEREMGYVFHHCLRVAGIAAALWEQLGRRADIDPDILFAGALFHDVAKGTEPHSRLGALTVAELLASELAEPQLQQVARVVREHNSRKQSWDCLPASQIVQDADVLDHFGAQSVWLVVGYAAVHDEPPEACLEFYLGPDHQDEIARRRKGLNFEVSRESFDRRVAFERRFFERLADEQAGRL